ncbi:MAG: 4'-phosphopantetheinyl transferase superfamily protein [bacterium]
MIDELNDGHSGLQKRFGPPPGYAGNGMIRFSWRQPASAMAPAQSWCCQCVDEGQDQWDKAVAPYILLEQEWIIWNRISHIAVRRRWLRGRVAAKDAMRLLLWHRHGIAAPLEAICVLPDEFGRPLVSCPAMPGVNKGVSVSISHCNNRSVALAIECSASCSSVGLDVASRTDNHEGLAEGGFAAGETALLDDCPASERSDWLLYLWCAKEAACKALGVGLMGNPLNFAVKRVNRQQLTVEVEASPALKLPATQNSPPQIAAHVGRDPGVVFAVVGLKQVIPKGDRKHGLVQQECRE